MPLKHLLLAVSDDFKSLHDLLLQRPLTDKGADRSELVQSISARTGPSIALQIVEEFERLRSNDRPLLGFRASIVYPFESDEESWPILEWKESDGTNGLAIFEADEDSLESYSYLVHYERSDTRNFEGRNGNMPTMAWKVTDMSVLKTLFQAMEHALGILKMPKSDALALYCHGAEGSVSDQPDEYALPMSCTELLAAEGCKKFFSAISFRWSA